jgi:hypothetical protein
LEGIEKTLDDLYSRLRKLNGYEKRSQVQRQQKHVAIEPKHAEISFADIAIIKDKKEEKPKDEDGA